MAKNPLIELLERGQSFWLDNIRREWLSGGDLAAMVEHRGLRGLTSNPSIFHDAITTSSAYDAQLRELTEGGAGTVQIYEALAISDIRAAADVLRPVFDSSDGVDGYVSLEVSPWLAHDTDGTTAEGLRLFKAVGRPNVMIKVPGTEACVASVRSLIAAGVPVNVTLLFSPTQYEATADAYLAGLEDRVESGLPLNVASVASVFLSRIDNLVDSLLGQRILPSLQTAVYDDDPANLMGKTAVSACKVTYERFEALFSSDRWALLAERGARVQRPLWASTSTKNPLYSDVCYVEPLIGPHTVNTLPDGTAAAFEDHGVVREASVKEGLDEAKTLLRDLAAHDIDLDEVCTQLQEEGIAKFSKSFGELLASISRRRIEALDAFDTHQTLKPGALAEAHKTIAGAFEELRLVPRLWANDASLWRLNEEGTASVAKRLGWTNLPAFMADKLDGILALVEEVRAEGFEDVVLLGMGGSSQTAEVASTVFDEVEGALWLRVLDSTHPAAIRSLEEALDLKKTLFIVASKTGTTLESLSLYTYFATKVGAAAKRQMIAITNEGTPLHLDEANFRAVYLNPSNINGRYSALSYFGLVPMALGGVDVKSLLARAAEFAERNSGAITVPHNDAAQLGALLAAAHQNGRTAFNIVTSSTLDSFGDWLEQMLAESTGKQGKGLLPVVREPIGDGAGRLYAFIRLESDGEEWDEVIAELVASKTPVIDIVLPDSLDLGQEFLRWELAVAYAAVGIGVNPFDEPDVKASKTATTTLLEQCADSDVLSKPEPVAADENFALQVGGVELAGDSVSDVLDAFFGAAAAAKYVGLMTYLPIDEANTEAQMAVREAIMARLPGVPTSTGFGPRLLHSTGQLYKGGPVGGFFVQIVDQPDDDLALPGATNDFGTIVSAQSLGDFLTLVECGRSVLRVTLRGAGAEGMQALAKMIRG